jgi:hypothetical protein
MANNSTNINKTNNHLSPQIFICSPYQDLVFQLHMSSIPGPGFPTSYVLHTRTWFSNFICPPYQDLVFQLHMSSIMKLENQVLVWRTYEVGKPGPGMEDIWSWKTRSLHGAHMKLETQVLVWDRHKSVAGLNRSTLIIIVWWTC